jgi:hypothetical protein
LVDQVEDQTAVVLAGFFLVGLFHGFSLDS